MDKKKELSIIIVTHNSHKYIKDCLDSIINYSPFSPAEYIIIDNNSADQTVEIINSLDLQLTLIQNKVNLGFAKACNQGINLAKGKYVFLLNPDTQFLNDVLSGFFEYMEKEENEFVWCVGAQLYDEYNIPSKSFGRFPGLLDVISEQLGIKGMLLKIRRINSSLKNRNMSNPVEVQYVMGCDMFVKRDVFDKIGLFNEDFFLNFEETELSWRAKKYGFKSMLLSDAKILHYSGGSFPDLKTYLSHLWLGQLLFFKLTHSRIIFLMTKIVHLLGTFLRFIFKFDKDYLSHAKKILSI